MDAATSTREALVRLGEAKGLHAESDQRRRRSSDYDPVVIDYVHGIRYWAIALVYVLRSFGLGSVCSDLA